MSNLNRTVASLNSIAAEMSLLKHPFYQQWTAGTLSANRLRNYATQYYRHVAAFPRYLSALHSRCDDLETRQVLLENLIDEERGDENHPELWLRFAQALGVSRAEVTAAEPLPAADALVSTFDHLSRELPLSAGLSALYVYESQVAEVANAKIEGLRRFYGFADDAKADATKFFEVHRGADPYHAQAVARLIERHDTCAEDRAIALEAGRTALRAVWDLLDCV
ncbi:MAG TPA: CADD family putative folate metabolism protein [Candidatus Binataceae bacterium]|nr:CADD family putative folate metabolism protein [Candidatus Binataceae bacterium]